MGVGEGQMRWSQWVCSETSSHDEDEKSHRSENSFDGDEKQIVFIPCYLISLHKKTCHDIHLPLLRVPSDKLYG